MNSQKMDTQTCRLLLIENKADLDIKDVSIRDVLNSLMWDVKAGIKAAADAVVIFPSFSGMSFSL